MFSGEQQGMTESMPTMNLFEHWVKGAELPRSVDARHYHLPSCFAIACPWNYSPKAVSMKEVVKGVANDSLTLISQEGVANNSVSPGNRYLNQPFFFQKGPSQKNDVALAEALVIAMRIAATRELKLNGESKAPTLQTVRGTGYETVSSMQVGSLVHFGERFCTPCIRKPPNGPSKNLLGTSVGS